MSLVDCNDIPNSSLMHVLLFFSNHLQCSAMPCFLPFVGLLSMYCLDKLLQFYVCGLNDQSKDMYEDYQRLSTKTLSGLGMHYSMRYQCSKLKEMIESTDFTHSSRKAWKTINKLTKDYTEPQQQCKVTADQVAHQLLLNGKGNKLHVPGREKMPRQTVTESKLTSPFLMEDLLHGVKALKNNKAAGLDDMLCEQIKHFGEATLRWLLQMMNSILKTHKFPKLWRK